MDGVTGIKMTKCRSNFTEYREKNFSYKMETKSLDVFWTQVCDFGRVHNAGILYFRVVHLKLPESTQKDQWIGN